MSTPDADDVLRTVVAELAARYRWAGISFVENEELVLGPSAGEPDEASRVHVPVTWQGVRVAELAVDGAPEGDRMSLERVADSIAGQCLVGWDTGGEDWEP
jgi:hypothetical protein